jgi:hypothetical protein
MIVCVRPAYALCGALGLRRGRILHSVLRTRVSSRSSFCKGYGSCLRRALCRYRIWANPFGGGTWCGVSGCERRSWLAGLPTPRKGSLVGRENGRGLRPPSERGPKSSGLCPFVVVVAEVDRRHLASNKLSRAPQKGNAARVNGGLDRRSPAHCARSSAGEEVTANRIGVAMKGAGSGQAQGDVIASFSVRSVRGDTGARAWSPAAFAPGSTKGPCRRKVPRDRGSSGVHAPR